MERREDVGGHAACVIMHNIIVEDERGDRIYDGDWKFQGELVESQAGTTS
jgi:hypothetical protein